MAAKKKAVATPPDGSLEQPSGGKLAKMESPPAPTVVIGRTERTEMSEPRDITLHRLDQVMHALQAFIPNILTLEAAAARAKIDSEDTFNKGSLFISSAKRQWEQIEALRKSVYQPIWDYGKLIQATFNPYLHRLDVVQTKVNGLMIAFYKAEEKRKADEAAAQRKAQEEAAQKVAEQHEAAGRPDVAQAVLDAAVSAPAPARQVDLGKTTNVLGDRTQARRTWKGSVADERAVLQAILDGKLPGGASSWLDWKQSALNSYAVLVKAEGVVNGIRVTHEVDLQQRKG